MNLNLELIDELLTEISTLRNDINFINQRMMKGYVDLSLIPCMRRMIQFKHSRQKSLIATLDDILEQIDFSHIAKELAL